MKARQVNSTLYPFTVLMVQTADHISPAIGAFVEMYISKNGSPYAAAAGTVEEIGEGVYALRPAASDVDTLGELNIVAVAIDADPTSEKYTIVAFDPFDANAMGMDWLTGPVALQATLLAKLDRADFLDAIRLTLRSDPALVTDLAALVAEVNADLGSGPGAFAPTTDAQQALYDKLLQITTGYPVVISSDVVGNTITVYTYDDWTISVPANIIESPPLVFAVKASANLSDSKSTLLINSESGLIYLNATPAEDPTQASLTFDSTGFTVAVSADVTSLLAPATYQWWLKSIGDNHTISSGKFVIRAGGVRQLS